MIAEKSLYTQILVLDASEVETVLATCTSYGYKLNPPRSCTNIPCPVLGGYEGQLTSEPLVRAVD